MTAVFFKQKTAYEIHERLVGSEMCIRDRRFDDILDANGNVRDEITLDAARTKSKRARKVFLPKQMQRQLREYVNSLNKQPLHGYLFSTQKQAHFSANTATQHLQRLYARAGIIGATSHSARRTWLTALSQRGVSVFVPVSYTHLTLPTTPYV